MSCAAVSEGTGAELFGIAERMLLIMARGTGLRSPMIAAGKCGALGGDSRLGL
jgi:hypothetical protein